MNYDKLYNYLANDKKITFTHEKNNYYYSHIIDLTNIGTIFYINDNLEVEKYTVHDDLFRISPSMGSVIDDISDFELLIDMIKEQYCYGNKVNNIKLITQINLFNEEEFFLYSFYQKRDIRSGV